MIFYLCLAKFSIFIYNIFLSYSSCISNKMFLRLISMLLIVELLVKLKILINLIATVILLIFE